MSAELAGVPVTDRREGPRKTFKRRATITLDDAPPIDVRTVDLSMGGVAFMTEHPLPEGLSCKIAIQAFFEDGLTHIIAKGRVADAILVGLQGYRIGMQFSSLDADTKALVSRVVNGK